jgi:hypothetical protein
MVLRWGRGERFEFERIHDVICSDSRAREREGAFDYAPFDRMQGEGVGTCNGMPGAAVSWAFTDGDRGRGRRRDTAEITVTDEDGEVVLQASGVVRGRCVAVGEAILPVAPRVDPENVVYFAEVDVGGRAPTFRGTRLPDEAFREDMSPPVGLALLSLGPLAVGASDRQARPLAYTECTGYILPMSTRPSLALRG